jgi:UDP-N-acetylmuramate--alanine ligase
VAGLTNHGHRNALAVADEAALAAFLTEQGRPGDMLICLGAGSISAWAHGLVK